MEVPNEVLRKLLCENCENYLSRGPVLMLVDGRNRCGRCTEPEEAASRNAAYEELAKLMTFPCRYNESGCEEKLTFETNLEHEESCSFQKYICPVLEVGKCDWSGIREDLLEHCKEHHPDSVLENPVKLTHTITASSIVNYLISALSLLFLVQVKVCTATRKIYHTVRLLGNSNSAAKYEYDIDIANNRTKMIMNGNVLPRGCLVLQEDTSIAIGINIILQVFGNFQNTTFTITVRAKEKGTEGNVGEISVLEKQIPTANAETSTEAIEKVKCVKCQCMREPVLREGLRWICRICSMTKITCRYGCGIKEIDGKCQKHEIFFCYSNQYCVVCRITDHRLFQHQVNHYTNEFFLYAFSFSWNYVLMNIRKDSRQVLCNYWLGDSDFAIYIFINAPSNELHKFDCMMEIEHPKGGTLFKQKLDCQYDRIWDWGLRIPRNEFSSYAEDNEFKMKISVIGPQER